MHWFKLQNGLGASDFVKWSGVYSPVFNDSSKIKAACIKDFSALSEDEEKEFTKLISRVQILVSDPEYFSLNLLLILTRTDANKGKFYN